MSRIETICFGVAVAALSTPAFAGNNPGAPAPLLGVGVGAAVLVGIGYRAIKSRIRP
jgi:hypothetical protein